MSIEVFHFLLGVIFISVWAMIGQFSIEPDRHSFDD